MTITSTEIKNNLEKLHKDIAWEWNIIRTENKIQKGFVRHYDMKAVLQDIETKANLRIMNKLDQLCVNLGLKSREDMPKNSIYPTIFKLSEINEQFVQLGIIMEKCTINPAIKIKKGKKALKEEEALTRDFLTKKRNNLQLQIVDLKKKLTEFNEATSFDISKPYDFMVA